MRSVRSCAGLSWRESHASEPRARAGRFAKACFRCLPSRMGCSGSCLSTGGGRALVDGEQACSVGPRAAARRASAVGPTNLTGEWRDSPADDPAWWTGGAIRVASDDVDDAAGRRREGDRGQRGDRGGGGAAGRPRTGQDMGQSTAAAVSRLRPRAPIERRRVDGGVGQRRTSTADGALQAPFLALSRAISQLEPSPPRSHHGKKPTGGSQRPRRPRHGQPIKPHV